jgi:Pectate lyase superfamily protein
MSPTSVTRRRSVLAGTFAGAAGLAAAAGILPGTSTAARAATTTSEDGTTDWINVVSDYGADPSGDADSTTDIQNAIENCPVGGVVYFPAGTYTVSSPLLIKSAGVRLLGSHSGNNGFEGGGSNAAIINAASGFSGDAILDTNGQSDFSARDLNVHGHNMTTGTTIGINVNGGALLEDVLVAYTVGTGIKIRNGVTVMHQVGVFHAGNSTGTGSGFDIDEADCWYTNCLSSGHATSGWAISGADNTTFTACRSEDGLPGSGAQGFVLTMTEMYGGISFNQCTTDLNDGDGFVIDGVTGNGCIQLNGCEFRRDGGNNTAGGGGYSGLKVVNTTAPVVIDGTTVTAREGDSASTASPVYGLTMTGSAFVSVNGGYLSSATGGRPVNWDGSGKLLVTPGLLTATVSGATATLNLPAPSGDNASPQDQNLLAWSYDPVLQTDSSIPAAGVLTLIKVPVYRACSVTNILLEVATAGSGLTSGENWAGLYTADGALIGKTADQSSAWESFGLHTAALAGGPYYVSQGWVYVAILTNGTTRPAFGRATVQGSGAVNAGLTVAAARYAVNSSAQTTLPSSITMSSNAFSATTYWAALS